MHNPPIQHIGKSPENRHFWTHSHRHPCTETPLFFGTNEYQFPLFSILDLPLSRLFFFAKIECRKGRILGYKNCLALPLLSYVPGYGASRALRQNSVFQKQGSNSSTRHTEVQRARLFVETFYECIYEIGKKIRKDTKKQINTKLIRNKLDPALNHHKPILSSRFRKGIKTMLPESA